MSESPIELETHSKSKLIHVHHVGVTTQPNVPLKRLLGSSSSTDTDNPSLNRTPYSRFLNETPMETTTDCTSTDCSKLLYELRAVRNKAADKTFKKATPSKIEFQLYRKPATNKRKKRSLCKSRAKRRKERCCFKSRNQRKFNEPQTSFLERLRQSWVNLNQTRQNAYKQAEREKKKEQKIFSDFSEPNTQSNFYCEHKSLQDVRIGIYHFEHGNAEFLRTTDCHPELISIMLAERATRYATRFWAEFFGTIHIGVTFVVTFFLQTYRFLLFTLINTLLVGFLHMTSDYLLKPLLTVFFNGYLQPPLILIYNILASIRDILQPVAETINNFIKPIATVGRSVRLIHVNNTRRYTKQV